MPQPHQIKYRLTGPKTQGVAERERTRNKHAKMEGQERSGEPARPASFLAFHDMEWLCSI